MSNVVPLRPAANDVLAALAEASRLLAGRHGEVPATLTADRARKVTAAAMREVFEKLSWREIARAIGGFEDPDNLQALLTSAARASWWNDTIVEQVVGAFMARYIGTRA